MIRPFFYEHPDPDDPLYDSEDDGPQLRIFSPIAQLFDQYDEGDPE